MILVDSRVWIDYFRGVDSQQSDLLDMMLGTELVAVGDLILTEVLQGFRHDEDFEQASELFSALTIFNMLGQEIALASAENYQYLLKQGFTVLRTVDVIIATFCIEQRIPLLFSDKDFILFVERLGLVDVSVV